MVEYLWVCTQVRDLDWRYSVFIHLHIQEITTEGLLDARHWSKHWEYSSKEKGVKILVHAALSFP